MMFWSRSKQVVHDFTEKTDCFITLEDTLLGSVLDGLSWCGKENSKGMLEKKTTKKQKHLQAGTDLELRWNCWSFFLFFQVFMFVCMLLWQRKMGINFGRFDIQHNKCCILTADVTSRRLLIITTSQRTSVVCKTGLKWMDLQQEVLHRNTETETQKQKTMTKNELYLWRHTEIPTYLQYVCWPAGPQNMYSYVNI